MEMIKGSKGLMGWPVVWHIAQVLVYLGLLLGFVEDLVPLSLGGMSRFICNGKFLGDLNVIIVKFVCLKYLVSMGFGCWLYMDFLCWIAHNQ